MYRSLPHFLLIASIFVFARMAEARDYSALVVEPESGRVLYEKFADELRHPASVTKMMTLYLVFEALERGELTLNTPFDISRNAVLRPPSRLGLTPGDTLAVEDAILALVTRSANDAATVIAENLGGTEAQFAGMMTAKAHSLGMRDTLFRNASGLPDDRQVTTAWDMSRLAKALLKDFPRYYPYFSTPRFYYRGQSFDNHNHLMETYQGMDGIKTGFINSSGFNLVASATRNGRRLIGVVFGGPSAVRRDDHMREILDDGFAQLDGAPAGDIVAEFEMPASARGQGRFSDREDIDPPQVTFGSAKRFKTPHTDYEDPRVLSNKPPRVYRSPVQAADPPVNRGRSAPNASGRVDTGKVLPDAGRHHGVPAKPVPRPSTHVQPSPATPPRKGDTRTPQPTAKAVDAHAHDKASVCKGAKDKNGKCHAK